MARCRSMGSFLCECLTFLALCGIVLIIVNIWHTLNPLETLINLVFMQDVPPGTLDATRLALHTHNRPGFYPL